ncbi:BON domain-containing protein [Pseudotabrizicola sediminis]|uniref:Small-conductance mechanosensitive channel n=1 Tax=Pseudotabrizicola sediminis TaxID=2486418 RepID=A0ABY2KIR5_9RHOB|nr:mechanosensitive ion channel family protein [Pseudotabrizicola sediminis]TGD42254.1 BON domain-containing protein [Pseudotabrizicola sediminis]
MIFLRRLESLFGRFAILTTFLFTVATAPVQAQTSPVVEETVAPGSTTEIAVAPGARDTQIADRLRRILTASNWFSPFSVSVREGIVFLDGQTETDERRDWAQQLALRTQDVVAVVNRIEVQRAISWDLTPTWREMERLVNRAQWFVPLTVVSLIILLVFWLVSRGVTKLARVSLRQRLSSPLLVDIAARALALPVILIGIYLVLQIAGLTRLAVTVLGGTGLVGIVLGLAFRDIAENALASILLSVRNPFRTGDWIQLGEYQGIVQNLNMRTTILMTLDGNHVQIPNSLVFKSVITNFSANPNRRAEFHVGIGYANSIALAQELIVQALRAHPAVLDDPEPAAIVDELGPSTVNIKVQFWFDGKSYSLFKVRSSLMRQVKRALQDEGISTPAPAQEVVFPEGTSFHQHPVVQEPAGEVPRPLALIRAAETATVSTGEGNLKSEQAELKRQAKACDLPEAEDNLLNPEVGASAQS